MKVGYAREALRSNPAGLWVGSSGRDLSGNARDLTVEGTPTLWLPGRLDRRRAFRGNGTDAALARGDACGITSGTSVTLEAWVMHDAAGNGGAVIHVGQSAPTFGNGWAVGFGNGGNNFSTGHVATILFEGVRWSVSGVSVLPGLRHMVLGIAASGAPTVWIDGAPVFTGAAGSSNAPTSASPTTNLGGYTADGPTVRRFDGLVLGGAVYRSLLTTAQVRRNYLAGVGRIGARRGALR